MLIAIVGPSAEVVSGSLLRPINIYYSLKSFKNIRASYIPLRKVFDLLLQLRRILHADVIIVSGVNPWISASIAVSGKILRKKVVTDFHGFAWLEANMTNGARVSIKVLFLISEKISYKLSQYVITASKWLANILAYHFGDRKDVIVIENAVPYVFEEVACKLMENYDSSMLRKYVCEKVLHRGDCFDKLLFIAPLPSVFKSNILAYKELLKLKPLLNKNVVVIVTGVKRADAFESQGNIIPIGYVNYVNYIALLLSSDGVILPYPSNAICGGIRNKVLEAGFCRKPVISTKIGVMHAKVAPNMHYMAIDNEIVFRNLKKETLHNIAKNLGNLIKGKYSFTTFKKILLKLLKLIAQERKEYARRTNITKNARKSDYKDFLCRR